MIAEERARELLAPFGVRLEPSQLRQVLVYLDLLLKWNEKINLTAVRTREECLTRHFGESFLLGSRLALAGRALDIGSGAGFPGLALKILFPALSMTLLEPVARKRAFLKEVTRACVLAGIEIRPERLEEFARSVPRPRFDIITARAVGSTEQLVEISSRLLSSGGHLCLWLSHDQGTRLSRIAEQCWLEPLPIPLSRQREIWIATPGSTRFT